MPATSAQPNRAVVTMIGDRQLRIERMLNAPRERVWRAISEPSLIAQWWGRGNTLDVERMEFTRGGHWRFVEHAHGQTHGFEGRYREIDAPAVLESTFDWDGTPGHVSVDRYTFEDTGDGRTRLVSLTTFMSAEERDAMCASGMEIGVNASYDALDRLLERLRRPSGDANDAANGAANGDAS
jgi:uncharacterized protein YndB with AHSA1/START domain